MSTSSGRTVLIADDAPDEATLYAEYVGQREGITPLTALSAEEALDRLGSTRVDCLVSDSLQTADGESLVAVAKEHWPDLPVLLHSGRPREEVPTDAADRFLQKGSTTDGRTALDALVATIDEMTGQGERPLRDRGRGWVSFGTYDWREESSPSMTVLQELNNKTDVDIETMQPLYVTVEPDAVDQFLSHAAETPTAGDSHVQFRVGDYLVRLSADGTVELAVDSHVDVTEET